MSKNYHGHADTFNQNENNIYGYTDSKGQKKTCQNIQHILLKLDEFKNNICNIKDEFKPHILVMCETFSNEDIFDVEIFWTFFKPLRFSIL
jgi:hypothetical protein